MDEIREDDKTNKKKPFKDKDLPKCQFIKINVFLRGVYKHF